MAVNHDGKVSIDTQLNNKGVESGLKAVTGKLGGLAKTVGKVSLAIVAAFGAAAVAITKQSVDAYADWEQLTGGVETLFKNSADKVKKYAEDAFYTAGISANEYMETVTGVSASLISSLGGDTEKAADIANMAIIDMADNANKMGTPLENVKAAYAGFAKQQYQLLDNLALGYQGTKTEMERLLKDAEAFSGVKYDINNLGDVYSAIHAIQEKMGIAGATAAEAEKTITGSANMTKAAWKNVLVAISGGGDLDKAINNLVYSVSKYFDNIVPVVERSLAGIGQLIEKIAPQLVESVAISLIKALPNLLNAVYQMIVGLANGIYKGIVALFTSGSMTSEVTAQLNDVATAANNAAGAEENLAAGITAASKAAKKSVAGFDELNLLQSTTGSGAGSSGDVGGAFNSVSATLKVTESTEEMAKTIPWLESILKALEPVKKGFNDAFTADLPKLRENWNNLVTELRETFSDPTLMTTFESFRESLAESSGKVIGAISGIGTSFSTGVVGGIEDATGRLKDFNKVKLTSITKNLENMVKTTGDLATACGNVATIFEGDDFQGIVEFFSMLGDVMIMDGLDQITGFFSDLWDLSVKPITDNADKFKEIGDKLLEIGNLVLGPAKELIDKIAEKTVAYEDSTIHKFFVDATNFASSKVGIVLDKVSGFLDDVIAFLKGENDLGRWFSENVAPAFSLEKWEALFENAKIAFNSKWTELETWWNTTLPNWWNNDIAAWFTKEKWESLFVGTKDGFVQGWKNITEWWENFTFTELWDDSIAPWFTVSKWEDLLSNVKTAFSNKWVELEKWWDESALGGLWEKVTNFFDTTKWDTELSSLSDVFETAFTDASNAAIKVLNDMITWINEKLNFTIPALEVDGKQLWPKTNVTLAKLPKIPYLAQGAVLPPNKPFMAMVGDQRHGTNVEAPLSTIQEAVAIVMQDQTQAILAGFEASVGVQREILEAVLGIQIGDDVIGNAVSRYNTKHAIIRGGAL